MGRPSRHPLSLRRPKLVPASEKDYDRPGWSPRRLPPMLKLEIGNGVIFAHREVTFQVSTIFETLPFCFALHVHNNIN